MQHHPSHLVFFALVAADNPTPVHHKLVEGDANPHVELKDVAGTSLHRGAWQQQQQRQP